MGSPTFKYIFSQTSIGNFNAPLTYGTEEGVACKYTSLPLRD